MSPEPSPPNRFQRCYFAWATPHYARMPADVRAQAEAIDRLLYSRRGLGVWLGAAGSLTGSTLGLHAAGLSWSAAVVLGSVLVAMIAFGAVAAWLRPERYAGRRLWRIGLLMMLGTYAGSLSSILASAKVADAAPGRWLETVLGLVWRATPFQLGVGLMLLTMMWVTAQARRQVLQRELATARLEQERDGAARQAAEARLRLLQAQIQPHFIFNTLATLQHWVDSADPRAGPLLRSLGGFLRGSTELLGQTSARLGDEVVLVGHYLAILHARLGERLRFRLDVPEDCAALPLPPGLLLTLVENAVEHGVSPALAGGSVTVQARLEGGRLQLDVSDDGVGLPAQAQDGVGLTNCRERLRHAYGERATLSLAPLRPGTRARLVIEGV